MPLLVYFASSRSRGRSPLLDMIAAQNFGSLFAGLVVQQGTVSFYSLEKCVDVDVRIEVFSFIAKTGYHAYAVYLKLLSDSFSGSPLRSILNNALRQLAEAGTIQSIFNEYGIGN